MKCKLMAALLSASLMPCHSYALAIGNAKTLSGYGQPIVVEVELYDVSGVDQKSVSYKIGSMYGDGKKVNYQDAKFGFYSSGNIGWLTISLSEPSLFRKIKYEIEVKWPGGKMARSYSGEILGGNPNTMESECHSNETLFRCVK